MITQAPRGLDSRKDANPFFVNKGIFSGNLPIITAPMYSVVDNKNYQLYLDNNINVCLPREIEPIGWNNKSILISLNLSDFINRYVTPFKNKSSGHLEFQESVCIDVANGNMPALHKAIKKAKSIHQDKLFIIAGNVSSVGAFEELSKTGVDGIRVGVGGSSACTTTVHTAVGQSCLQRLVSSCRYTLQHSKLQNKPLIIADGISSYIKANNLHRNGYAAINILLYHGADLVMIGGIFSKAIESSAEKVVKIGYGEDQSDYVDVKEYLEQVSEDEKGNKVDLIDVELDLSRFVEEGSLYSVYKGMSTREEQKKYKKQNIKPSEGKIVYKKVEYSLQEWVQGCTSHNHDEFPGYKNALTSAMSYTGARQLDQFKK